MSSSWSARDERDELAETGSKPSSANSNSRSSTASSWALQVVPRHDHLPSTLFGASGH